MLQPNALIGDLVYLTNVDVDNDVPLMFKWHNDMDFLRYLHRGLPHFGTQKDLREWMEADFRGRRETRPMMIRRREDDVLLGFCAFKDMDKTARNALFFIAIRPDESYQGKGYGTDAVRVMMRFAFQEMNLQRLGLEVGEFNVAAKRSYEKCGFQVEGTIRRSMYRDGKYWDMHYMGILREEWEATLS
jgi:RimJ/RimL family protein N-acetyltransferase